MKKNIITALVVAGAMLMSAPVYAASQKTETENTTEGNAQVIGGVDGSTDIFIDGGWEVHFAPLSGHRCVCRRTLGGGNGQRFNQSLSVLS